MSASALGPPGGRVSASLLTGLVLARVSGGSVICGADSVGSAAASSTPMEREGVPYIAYGRPTILGSRTTRGA